LNFEAVREEAKNIFMFEKQSAVDAAGNSKEIRILNCLVFCNSVAGVCGVVYPGCKKRFIIFILWLHVLLFLILPEEGRQKITMFAVNFIT
jgi:hypothetical protein